MTPNSQDYRKESESMFRHCDQRHKRNTKKPNMRQTPYDVFQLWCLSPYYVCRLWRLSHYDVCRIMTFVSLWRLSHYDVCRQLWHLSLTGFVAASMFLIHCIFVVRCGSRCTSVRSASTTWRSTWRSCTGSDSSEKWSDSGTHLVLNI